MGVLILDFQFPLAERTSCNICVGASVGVRVTFQFPLAERTSCNVVAASRPPDRRHLSVSSSGTNELQQSDCNAFRAASRAFSFL